jgi:hypothetical protein
MWALMNCRQEPLKLKPVQTFGKRLEENEFFIYLKNVNFCQIQSKRGVENLGRVLFMKFSARIYRSIAFRVSVAAFSLFAVACGAAKSEVKQDPGSETPAAAQKGSSASKHEHKTRASIREASVSAGEYVD